MATFGKNSLGDYSLATTHPPTQKGVIKSMKDLILIGLSIACTAMIFMLPMLLKAIFVPDESAIAHAKRMRKKKFKKTRKKLKKIKKQEEKDWLKRYEELK